MNSRVRHIYKRIITKSVYDDNLGRFVPREWFWSDGPIAELKKGRETQQAVANQQLSNASSDAATRKAALGGVNNFTSQIQSTAPGQLSPYARAQLASDMGNISTTYGNLKSAGLKGIAQRGLGAAPTGAVSSLTNSLDRAKGADENSAYENALKQQYGENLDALKANMGIVGEYNPEQDLSGASNSALDESRMGSTLGDIGGGIATVAGLGKSIAGLGGIRGIPGSLIGKG